MNEAIDADIPMVPDASPGGVRRVNNRPIYILISVVAVTMFILVMSMVDRSARQDTQQSSQDAKAGTPAGAKAGKLERKAGPRTN